MRRVAQLYRSKKIVSQAGDTIIEVMMAIAVVGFAVVASYNIANRATKTGRYAQEQSEALRISETQLERVKYLASQMQKGAPKTGTVFDAATGTRNFCVKDDFSKVASSDNACGSVNGLYSVVVVFDGVDLFRATTSWDSPYGTPATVSVGYRVFAP